MAEREALTLIGSGFDPHLAHHFMAGKEFYIDDEVVDKVVEWCKTVLATGPDEFLRRFNYFPYYKIRRIDATKFIIFGDEDAAAFKLVWQHKIIIR